MSFLSLLLCSSPNSTFLITYIPLPLHFSPSKQKIHNTEMKMYTQSSIPNQEAICNQYIWGKTKWAFSSAMPTGVSTTLQGRQNAKKYLASTKQNPCFLPNIVLLWGFCCCCIFVFLSFIEIKEEHEVWLEGR